MVIKIIFWILLFVGVSLGVYVLAEKITHSKQTPVTANMFPDSATATGAVMTTTTIGTSDFSKNVEDSSYTIIDVRTPSEYAEGHIQGAKNIDFSADDFTSRIESLPRDASYALYCRSGNRSKKALDVMTSLGFTHVVDMRGGIQAWASEDRGVCREC